MKRCEVNGCDAWDTCEHHIVTKGAGGDDSPDNIMWLCVYHHIEEFHRRGWRWFSREHPELEERIVDARVRQGKRI